MTADLAAVTVVVVLAVLAAATWLGGRSSVWLRAGSGAVAAVAAVTAGVRFPPTGAPGADAVLAVVFLFLASATAPFATAGRSRGVAWAPVVALGVLVVALPAGTGPVVVLAAALVVVCVAGVLLGVSGDPLRNRVVASAGPVVGFVLGAATLLAAATLSPEDGGAFVVLAWVLPVADLVVTGLSRLRRRQPLVGGAGDHLTARLGRSRLGRRRAGWVVLGAAGLLVSLGVLVGWGVLAAGPTVLAGVVLAAVVVVTALRSPAPPEDDAGAVGIPRVAWWVGVLAVMAVALPAVPALGALWTARGPAVAGEQAADQALALARQGHLTQAADRFTVAKARFAEARRDLDAPLASIGLRYPVLSTNLTAIRTLSRVGESLAGRGQNLALASDRFRYGIRGGTVPVAQLAATAPQFTSALATVDGAEAAMTTIRGPYLLPPVTRAVSGLERQLGPARRDVVSAQGIAVNLPGLLGLDGPRRYFLAFQTDAEARATGGLIGLNGILVADQGHLQLSGLEDSGLLNRGGDPVRVLHAPADYLARYGSFDPADNWQMVNLSPDFPTVGAVITDLYPQSGGTPVDGVVAVDPEGLAAMMQLTGPITVPGWPVPIDSANVSAITQNQSYVTYAGADVARQAFLEGLIRAVFDRLSNLNLHDPVVLIDDLAPAVRGGHLLAYSTRSSEQAYLASVGMAGAVPPVASDALELTTQNASANKIDYYLHRTVDDQVHLAPQPASGTSGSPVAARATSQVSVSLDNTAPASGLPPVVIGPGSPGLVAGENRTFLTLYTPLQFSAATLGNTPTGLASLPELGRLADSTFVDVAAGQTATLSATLSGTVRLLAGGWYELDLPCQPLINPDHVRVEVTVASGWQVTGVRGATRLGSDRAEALLVTASHHTVWVQVARLPGTPG
jgi:hypothetical protein